jgi:hypothetical protein
MQENMPMDLTPSCLSSPTMEVKGDASKSTMWLRNALQFQAVHAIVFTQTYLNIFMRNRIQAAVDNIAAVRIDISRPSV